MSDGQELRRVMVATDFSDTAGVALDWARAIAARHGAALHVVHALAPPMPPVRAPEFVPLPVGESERLTQAVLERLDALATQLGQAGLEVTTAMPTGPAAATLVAEAARLGADLLVLGTRGHGGFARLLLGSTAARVVQRAACPVLTVHPDDRGRQPHVRVILVPTDFSEDAARAARQALRLLRPEEDGARLVLLHAYHVPVDLTLLGGAPVAAEQFGAVREAAKRELDTLAASLGVDLACGVETRVEEGRPVDAILRAAQELDVDLVAMGTHGRSGLEHLLLGSTAERVLPHAPCPVLTLRRSD